MGARQTRILLVAATTGYQTRMFGEAAERLDIELVFATDRCDQLDDPWCDRAIPIRFHQERASADAIVRGVEDHPPVGAIALGDRATTICALAAERLALPTHPPAAVAAARDKRQMRERLRGSGLRVPWFTTVPLDADASRCASTLPYPVVLKPLVLSGSRGVIRADTPAEFFAAFDRVRRLLHATDVRAMRDPAADLIQVESYIHGREFAFEGLLDRGALHALALFDKPDPLEGPFFEETIYVTPARTDRATEERIRGSIADAVKALGLYHGPIHAECRVSSDDVFVLEIAARPIGGLCAKALQFENTRGETVSLEELLLRHAAGASPSEWSPAARPSGVMMIPIPRGGLYRRTEGEDEARSVSGVWHLQITAKPDQQLVPLPEGASYLGFIFANGETPDRVEQSLREAHARLTFVIDRSVPVVAGQKTAGE